MLEKLLSLREKIINDYKNAPYRIVTDFKNEQSITKDYNSRQILEMLQNADDAKSSDVFIDWNTEHCKLRICNKGTAFSFEGFESLMISNYTSKTSGVFIGNKGLGFRSLLNWANEVKVYSSECQVSFSKERAENVLMNEIEISNRDLLDLNQRGGFSELSKPFPIMAAPDIVSYSIEEDWTTIIEINYYKKFEDSIGYQISHLKEEILLFLNNINNIRVEKDNSLILSHQSSKTNFGDYEIVKIGKKQWYVFGIENLLPDNLQDKSKSYQQKYQVKIAFQDGLTDSFTQLFNYFPTRVNVHLPCLLHGTFELNNSRDYLNDSETNQFIIKQYTSLFDKATDFLKSKNVNWLPLKLITTKRNDSDSLIIPLLYSELQRLVNNKELYPCIDGNYRHKSKVYFYTNEFNRFLQEKLINYFPDFVKPDEQPFHYQPLEINSFKQRLEDIPNRDLSISVRAELIYFLSKIIQQNVLKSQIYFDILINKDGKIIPSKETTFTPLVNKEDIFTIPHKYVSLDILNTELYTALNNLFKDDYKRGETEARELQRNIRHIVNIQPYDSSTVIQKIITSFSQYINSNISFTEKSTAIKEMVNTLFKIYKTIDRKVDVLSQSIFLLSYDDIIKEANELYLGFGYSCEKIVTYCYDEYLVDSDYLKEFSFWTFEKEDCDLVESFFNWLGVHSFLKTEKVGLANKWDDKGYFDLMKKEQPLSTDFNIGRILVKTQVTRIKSFEDLVRKITPEKLMILAFSEITVKRLIIENTEEIDWHFSNSNRVIKTRISYINYQFIKAGIYKNLLIESFSSEVQRFINIGIFDFDIPGQFGIDKQESERFLAHLGGKSNFNELSVSRLFEIIKKIPEIDSSCEGKGTQTVYIKILDNLSAKNIPTTEISKYFPLKFFGKKGDKGSYFESSELFYIANSIFSNQIIKEVPIINLPKRINETNISKYFGVKSLKESDIRISYDSIEYSTLNNRFQNEFENYKPYILIYRLFSPNLRKAINEEKQRIEETNLLKRLNINLVSNITFCFKGDMYTLSNNDFIANGNDYFIAISSSIHNVSDIFRDSIICDTLSEILSVQFKINELKSDFRFIVKNDLKDTEHIVSKEFYDYKEIISRLLGIPQSMFKFWEKYLQ